MGSKLFRLLIRPAAAADDEALLHPALYEALALLLVEEQGLTAALAERRIQLFV